MYLKRPVARMILERVSVTLRFVKGYLPSNNNGPETPADAVNIRDIARVLDALVINDLQVRDEKHIPAANPISSDLTSVEDNNVLEADEHRGGRKTGTEDHSIGKQMERSQAGAGTVFLPDGKENHADATKHEHADESGRLPWQNLIRAHADGNQREGEGGNDEDDSDHCNITSASEPRTPMIKLTVKVMEVVDDCLAQGSTLITFAQIPFRVCLVATAQEDKHDRSRDDWEDDCKGSKRPSPADDLVEFFRGGRTGKGSHDIGAGGKREKPATIFDVRGIGQENLQDICHTVVSDPIEDL